MILKRGKGWTRFFSDNVTIPSITEKPVFASQNRLVTAKDCNLRDTTLVQPTIEKLKAWLSILDKCNLPTRTGVGEVRNHRMVSGQNSVRWEKVLVRNTTSNKSLREPQRTHSLSSQAKLTGENLHGAVYLAGVERTHLAADHLHQSFYSASSDHSLELCSLEIFWVSASLTAVIMAPFSWIRAFGKWLGFNSYKQGHGNQIDNFGVVKEMAVHQIFTLQESSWFLKWPDSQDRKWQQHSKHNL